MAKNWETTQFLWIKNGVSNFIYSAWGIVFSINILIHEVFKNLHDSSVACKLKVLWDACVEFSRRRCRNDKMPLSASYYPFVKTGYFCCDQQITNYWWILTYVMAFSLRNKIDNLILKNIDRHKSGMDNQTNDFKRWLLEIKCTGNYI